MWHDLNPLSTKPTKWSNTLKHLVSKLLTNFLSVFNNFVGWRLKAYIRIRYSLGGPIFFFFFELDSKLNNRNINRNLLKVNIRINRKQWKSDIFPMTMLFLFCLEQVKSTQLLFCFLKSIMKIPEQLVNYVQIFINKVTRIDVVLVFLSLTLNKFHTLLWCLHHFEEENSGWAEPYCRRHVIVWGLRKQTSFVFNLNLQNNS